MRLKSFEPHCSLVDWTEGGSAMDFNVKPRRPLHHASEFNVFNVQAKQNNQLVPIEIQDHKQHYGLHQHFIYSGNVFDAPETKNCINSDEESVKTKNLKNAKVNYEPRRCRKIIDRVMNALDEYFETTTLHGLKYVGDTTISIFERLFWFGAFLTGLSFAAYFISSIYQKYDQSPMVISFNPKMVRLTQIPFPAITICNVNLVLRSRADDILQSNSSTQKRLLSDICNENVDDEYKTYSDSSTKNWSVVENFIIKVNQKCYDMVRMCRWNGTYYNCRKLINSVLTDEGYCCSFNRLPTNLSLRAEVNDSGYYPANIVNWNEEDGYGDAPLHYYPYRSEGPGQSLGLSLILDAQLNEYYCTSTNSIGFKLMFSSPTESPKIAEVGLLLSPGDEARISILPDIKDATDGVRSIDVNKRQCFFARERSLKYFLIYTEKNCRLECQANYTMQRCDCVPYYLPRNPDSPICDKEKEGCSAKAKDVVERFTPERSSCRCLPSCYDVSYKLDAMTIGKIVSATPTSNMNGLENVTYKYFARNMAVVHFYFEYDKFTKQTKSLIYGFSEFLSNTGGLLGLFLGFSFLSAVEIIYFILFRGQCRHYRQMRKEAKVKQMATNNLPYTK